MAAAFTEALEHATIGGVKLIVPDKEIKLDASNATVRLDSAAIVRLDPAARVAISNPEIFRPTERQLGGENQTQPGKVVTNFTVFKSVTFGSGAVDTGWNYDSSDQNAPSSQYCYYIQPRDGGDVRVSVAKDGHLIPNNLGAVFGLNDRLAAANCVWFNGQPTSF
ncbi:MAG: hypothetical protein JOZ22_22250 [Acidobacteriia bacterium]|nr:hypothetical protein [Terriglobia bacterium]